VRAGHPAACVRGVRAKNRIWDNKFAGSRRLADLLSGRLPSADNVFRPDRGRGSRSGRVAWQFTQELAGRLGVRLAPADKVEELAGQLARFSLVAVEFPSPSEGRGYTQGRLLRERFGFTGELRAVGAGVKRDVIFALARCGFDTFEVAPGEDLEAAARALDRYTVAYQPGAPVASVTRQRFSTA